MKTLLNLIVGISKNRLFLLIAIVLCINGVAFGQAGTVVVACDFGTVASPGVLTSSAGTVPNTVFNNTLTAGSMFYGFPASPNGALIQGANPGLLRIGTNTELQAHTGNSGEWCKFGITQYSQSGTLFNYTSFSVVFAGDNLAATTSGGTTWYFFAGDNTKAGSTYFLTGNTADSAIAEVGIGLKFLMNANGTVSVYNYDYTLNTGLGGWTSSPIATLDQKKKYKFDIYGNVSKNSSGSRTYSRLGKDITLSYGKLDIYINESIIGTQNTFSVGHLDNTGNMNKLQALAFYGKGGTGNGWIFLDDINCADGTPPTLAYYPKQNSTPNNEIDLSILSNWTNSETGVGGTSPTAGAFAVSYTTWIIRNYTNNASGTTYKFASNVDISAGVDSEIMIGDAGNTSTVRIPSGVTLAGPVDVLTYGDLVIETTNQPTIRTTGTNSIVEYTQTSSSTVTYPQYYNLKIVSGTKTLGANYVVDGRTTVCSGAVLVVPSACKLAGIVDVNDNGEIEVSNTTIPTYGTLGSNSTVKYSGTTAQTIPTSLTYGNLKISSSSIVTIDGTSGNTVNGTLTLESGSLSIGSNALYVNGAISKTSGTITGGTTSDIVFGGLGSNTTLPAVTNGLRNLEINRANGITLGAANSLSGNLTLTSGTLTDGGYTLSVAGNILGTGTHTGTGKISMTGTGKTISTASLGNFEVNSAGSVSLNGTPSFNGAFIMTNGTLSIGSNYLLLKGTASRTNGTVTGSSSSRLFVTGAGALGTVQFTEGSKVLKHLWINRTTSGSMTIGSYLVVSDTLTLTEGIINSNTISDSITLGTGINTPGYLNFSQNTNYTTWVNGKLQRYIPVGAGNNNNNAIVFPVGCASKWGGARLIYSATNGTTSGGTLSAVFTLGDPGTHNTAESILDAGGYIIDRYSKHAYWTVKNSGTAGTYEINIDAYGFPGVNNEVEGTKRQNLRVLKRQDANYDWVLEGSHSSGNGDQTRWTAKRTGLTAFSDFTLGAWSVENNLSDSPLPVSLQSLTSTVAGRDVKISWTTSAEINNAGFEIQRAEFRSENLEFRKAGFVEGKGTTNTQTTYTFSDSKLNTGKYKYRLKQIDNNGNFEYHNLNNEVEVSAPKNFELSQNYPNPFNPVTKIDFTIPVDSKVNIIIYDITGKEISTLMNESKTAGYYTSVFDASRLSSGVYFYRITAKNNIKDFSSMKKMMLIK